jgi:hypothetical protein
MSSCSCCEKKFVATARDTRTVRHMKRVFDSLYRSSFHQSCKHGVNSNDVHRNV